MVPRIGATAVFAALGLTVAAPAGAAETCVYDAVSRSVAASISAGSEATLRVGAGGEILFGLVPAACGAATTANTDSVAVSGGAGTMEKLTLDLSSSPLGPGATAESNIPEIELALSLGDAADRLLVLGGAGNDTIAMGANGLGLNADGDVDVTFAPLPAQMEIRGQGGVNFLTGRGGNGAGLAYAGSLTLVAGDLGDELNGGNGDDTLVGGAGVDVANGSAGNDAITGGGGNDRLSGGDGNDSITGGAGADELIAGIGDDTLDANDGEADLQIHGGPGIDTAYYDAGTDPAPIAVENIVDGPPPPPAPPAPPAPAAGTCVFHPGLNAVAATVVPNGQATLAVVSGQIRFGAAHVPCGAATNANTNTIFVFGSATARERLVIDLSGGPLAPGLTAEPTGAPEIEVVTKLGGPNDEIWLLGSAADDTLAVGTAGAALNADGDADVTFETSPAYAELRGLGGRNVLGAAGGFGSGSAFLGRTTIMAGALGDQLSGGNGDDLLVGGAGHDVLVALGGVDQLWGLGGNDALDGGEGNDALIGGAGVDSLFGGGGNDLLDSVDAFADAVLDGGAGADTAYFDRLADPAPIGVETLFPR